MKRRQMLLAGAGLLAGPARTQTLLVGHAPDEFARFVQGEITRWAKVVKFSGAKAE